MASMYTLGTLTTACADEARVGSDVKFVTIIQQLIIEILIETIIRDRPREYYVGNVVLPLSPVETVLPDDFLVPDRFLFTAMAEQMTWELSDESGPVCPARVEGKPASYQVTRDAASGLDPRLILYPDYVAADTMVIDYYRRPIVTDPIDEDEQILIDRAIPAIKREVLQRLQILQTKSSEQNVQVLQGATTSAQKSLPQS